MNTNKWDHMPRNSKWYAEYERRFDEFIKANKLEVFTSGPAYCPECDEEWVDGRCPECDADYEAYQEGGFSWRSCDCCGTNLGGDRYPMSGLTIEGEEAERTTLAFDCCQDCVYYAEYGQLDDMTMMDMDRLDKEASDDEDE